MANVQTLGTFLLILGAILGAIGGMLITVGLAERQNVILALNGELNPYPIDLSKPFTVQLSKVLGGNALTDINFTSAEMANGIDMNSIFPASAGTKFGAFTTNQLQIQFVNNKLYVSAVIKNSNGTTIAQILNNEWKTVDPSTLLFWDRNYNAYAFEIIGSDDVPTFQVIMVGSNRIEIGGLFFTTNGRIYFQPMLDGTMLYVNETDAQLEAAHIPTLFKYPALTDASNLGKMMDSFYQSSNPLSESTSTIVGGLVLVIIGPILFTFGFEKRKETEKKRRERRDPHCQGRKRPRKC